MRNWNGVKKVLGIPRNRGEGAKNSLKNGIFGVAEGLNEIQDNLYNSQYSSKYDKIDSFNQTLETIMHFSDGYTRIPYGHIGSINGRAVRGNYQNIYARNPLPDKFDRAFDSFKKATEYDY